MKEPQRHGRFRLPEDEHLREDINATGVEHESAAEFDKKHYTSSLLNAGQFVPGINPMVEYNDEARPEHDENPGQSGFHPPKAG
jgi:hypothetical protein